MQLAFFHGGMKKDGKFEIQGQISTQINLATPHVKDSDFHWQQYQLGIFNESLLSELIYDVSIKYILDS